MKKLVITILSLLCLSFSMSPAIPLKHPLGLDDGNVKILKGSAKQTKPFEKKVQKETKTNRCIVRFEAIQLNTMTTPFLSYEQSKKLPLKYSYRGKEAYRLYQHYAKQAKIVSAHYSKAQWEKDYQAYQKEMKKHRQQVQENQAMLKIVTENSKTLKNLSCNAYITKDKEIPIFYYLARPSEDSDGYISDNFNGHYAKNHLILSFAFGWFPPKPEWKKVDIKPQHKNSPPVKLQRKPWLQWWAVFADKTKKQTDSVGQVPVSTGS